MSDQSSQEGGAGIVAATTLLTGKRPLDGIPDDDRAPETAAPPKVRRFSAANRGRLVLLAFVAPALIIYLLMVIVPSIQSVQLSFTDWDGISDGYDYIGFQNYQDILTSGRFWNAVRNTLILGLGSAIIINVIALIVALLLDRLNHGQGFFRTAVYLPALVSAFIMATIWKYLLNYNFGMVNNVLRDLGLPDWARDWLGDSSIVVWVILFITCFTLGGNTTLIYLANLQSVPQELLEASKIDGANGWQSFWNVTWPMIAGAVTVNVTLAMIAGWVIFDQVMVLTSGGPGFVSETMAFFIYKVGFGEYRAGFGSAAAVVLFLVVIVSTVGANAYMRKREIQA
ncbi:multiple sugar transport system permease protein/raffinose/stachyose/melibiose transport system permease protein [Microbacterium terrae]|uniref:L-arabinose transport system permease protein AraP n=1 Tax=Microbacterium terrae TaxID=69369 RepID=A0A0M2HD97_9MICO|nr:sugar ABC transporter permease [Microbacterium terrae]KJL42669.1 L-arabinose transport system permease protein AraP [Microbacterium terrae]MBP1079099.1 multiple sugar transport system permease protein/raffinose/stachyose/melibiose transport system permease protein [Microbacterium terrae]GLJ98501.1 sugar ABC transporter permease [Microbacterium terrae]